MILLSSHEQEILYHFSLNGRMPIIQLAKKLNTSKQMISYYLKKMESSGIIKRYYAITNIYALGKAHYRVFIKLGQIDFDKDRQLRQFLTQHPKIPWVIFLDGDFDLMFVVWSDSIAEFEKVFDEVMERFGSYFLEKYFSIATRIEYLPYHFLAPAITEDRESLVFGNQYHPCKIDEVDHKLLTLLNHSGRISISVLSHQINQSSPQIKKRIAKLMKAKVIIGFNIKIDHQLLGYSYQKILLKLNDTSREKLNALTAFLKSKSSVIYLLKTIGSYDFEFELMSRSNNETYQLVNELRLTFADNIKSHNMVIMKEELKSEDLEL